MQFKEKGYKSVPRQLRQHRSHRTAIGHRRNDEPRPRQGRQADEAGMNEPCEQCVDQRQQSCDKTRLLIQRLRGALVTLYRKPGGPPGQKSARHISYVRKSQRDQLALSFAGTPAHAANDVTWTSTGITKVENFAVLPQSR
jgi:hypothetical protein